MRHALLALLLLVSVTLLAACTGSAPAPTPTPVPPTEPPATPTVIVEPTEPLVLADGTCNLEGTLTLGAVESFSGAAELYGQTIRRGIDLALTEINEQQFIGPRATLEVLYEDDASDKDQAAAAFLKLIREEEVLGILGPTLSNSAFSAHPVAQADSVPVVATSNTAPGITDGKSFIFRDSLPESDVIPNTINEARNALDLRSVFIIYGEDDAFTRGGFEAMERAVAQQGLRLLGTATFTKGQEDFSEILQQVEEADPDAVLVSALLNEAVLILQQMEARGLDKIVIGGNGFNSVQLIEQAGTAAEGVMVGAAWVIDNPSPENQAFVEAYREAYGSDPDQFAAQSYTGAWLFAHALRNACSLNRSDIRNALAELRLVPTPLGTFSFTTDRNPLHPPVVLIVEDGHYVLFEGD